MKEKESILSSCTSGGCGAKIGPGELSEVLEGLPAFDEERLLVGFDASDDAAVYRLDGKQSLISTVDFFSPMVEDARTFGKIAAANAMSDVYAMGGRPVLALNLVCFPEQFPMKMLGEILAGGAEKIAEAGAVLGGGHSIYDKETKYGLAVTGLVNTVDMIRNNTAKQGHSLILTKPLGVGIVMAAQRGGIADVQEVRQATDSMQRLNKYAAEKMLGYHVSACTDITGFGLLVHVAEMCGQKVSAEIYAGELPVLPKAREFAQEYILTAAGQRNRNCIEGKCNLDAVPFAVQELLCDPQTSGGSLICVDSGEADSLLKDIRQDDPQAAVVGRILPRQDMAIKLVGEVE